MREKKNHLIQGITVVLLLLSVVMLYIAHREVPFMMDDLWYSTMLSSEEPITNFSDIIQSQIWHYLNWGGRSITHGILQLTLLAGEHAADICNVLVTLLLSAVICVVAEYRKLPAFFAAFGMLLGLNANWKMSMFWQAGAANYLYITVFILLFLYCYLREVTEPGKSIEAVKNNAADKKRAALPGILFWIIPLGIMAGWSNENMGPAVWVISLLVIILQWKEKKKVKAWMILGNISCLLGCIVMIAAPGNFVRSAEVASNEYGVVWNLFLRCYAESLAALNYLFPVFLLLMSVLVISKGVLRIPLGRKNALLLFCALLSWGAMVLSPHYPDRATFGTMVLLICVVLSIVRDILIERNNLALWFWCANLLVWLRGMFWLGEYIAICLGWIQ